jgi:hypothetical protein
MQVITSEFKNAVLGQLLDLKSGFYLTRDQLCMGAGTEIKYANLVSILMSEPEFAEFETVKSRGIRRKASHVPA